MNGNGVRVYRDKKRCPNCQRRLPLTSFYKSIGQPSGYSIHCRSCLYLMPRQEANKPEPESNGDAHDTRLCLRCHEVKPLDAFDKCSKGRRGRTSQCHECRAIQRQLYRAAHEDEIRARRKQEYAKEPERYKDRILKRRFGITIQQYRSMHLAQGRRCAICGRPSSDLARDLAVDHDHDTGLVRGLLCSGCNTGLGNFKENVEVMRAAIAYIERFAKNTRQEVAA